jgi:sec-independent protein translocase protein TatB
VFGIGMSEMVIILGVALLVFGPQKLPEVAKTIAKGLRDLRRASDDLRSQVMVDLDDEHPRPPPLPAAKPFLAPDPPETPPAADAASPSIEGSVLARDDGAPVPAVEGAVPRGEDAPADDEPVRG